MKRGILARIGLDRPELQAWALYDWANSAMMTTIVAAVFPIYYYKVAGAGLPPGEATQRFALSTTIALGVVAVLAPFLGALADTTAAKKKFLGFFLGVGVISTACLFFVQEGDWRLGSVLFITATIGASGSLVFYDSLLPHVARPDEMDRVSTAGFALGFLGGGCLLGLQILWIRKPGWFGLPSGPDLSGAEATLPVRLAFVSVAVWWLLFSLPLFRRVPEPPATHGPTKMGIGSLQAALRSLRTTLRELRKHEQAFWMLLAFLVYNDGIVTIIKMASIYGTEIGIPQGALILAILMVQFVGIPFTILFGQLANRIGPKAAIQLSLVVYIGISLLAYFMTSAAHFFVLAFGVAMVQGGSQALSRSLFASLIPRHKSSEFFGFFAVMEKFAGLFGPALFATAIEVTGSSRNGIVSVIVFFVAGSLLLRKVDVEAGRGAVQIPNLESAPERDGEH